MNHLLADNSQNFDIFLFVFHMKSQSNFFWKIQKKKEKKIKMLSAAHPPTPHPLLSIFWHFLVFRTFYWEEKARQWSWGETVVVLVRTDWKLNGDILPFSPHHTYTNWKSIIFHFPLARSIPRMRLLFSIFLFPRSTLVSLLHFLWSTLTTGNAGGGGGGGGGGLYFPFSFFIFFFFFHFTQIYIFQKVYFYPFWLDKTNIRYEAIFTHDVSTQQKHLSQASNEYPQHVFMEN